MAKELPYFQFEPGQYLAGNIQFCTYEEQGIFINICALYWQRSCEISKEQLDKKFSKVVIDSLIDSNILKCSQKGKVFIEFLDEQFESIKASKLKCSVNGKKGALIKKQATLKPPLSQASATLQHLDKIREDKIIGYIDTKTLLSDLPNSSYLLEIADKNKITPEQCKSLIPFFSVKAQLEYPNPKEFYTHFKNWIPDNLHLLSQATDENLSKDELLAKRRKERDEYNAKTDVSKL